MFESLAYQVRDDEFRGRFIQVGISDFQIFGVPSKSWPATGKLGADCPRNYTSPATQGAHLGSVAVQGAGAAESDSADELGGWLVVVLEDVMDDQRGRAVDGSVGCQNMEFAHAEEYVASSYVGGQPEP